ncbi:MAG: hypothetical protein JXR13_01370 [Thalassovita sp.]
MSEWKLSKTRLFEGVWEGVLTTTGRGHQKPQIEVSHLQQSVPGVEVIEERDQGSWLVKVPIPVELISDGVQTFVIRDAVTDETLESFAVLAGETLADDLRAEVTLLREELDMLKRAFRRHCLETT